MWVETTRDYEEHAAGAIARAREVDRVVAFAVLPLVVGGERAGVITFSFATDHRFSPDERTLLAAIAHGCEQAIERAQLYATADAANRAKDEFLAMLGHELRNPLAPIATALEPDGGCATSDTLRAASATIIERQVAAPDAAGRRPARRLAHHARQDRAPAQSAVDVCATSSARPSRWRARCSSSAGTARGRRRRAAGSRSSGDAGAARAGRRQPAHQRGEVHAAGRRIASAVRATGERRSARQRARQRASASRRRCCRACSSSSCRASARSTRSRAGSASGSRSSAAWSSCTAARVEARSDGPRPGQRVRGAAAGRSSRARASAPAARAARAPPRPSAQRAAHPRRRRQRRRGARCSPSVLARHRPRAHASRPTGRRALELAREFEPDVALLDIGLPVMDGYELARRLRELDRVRADAPDRAHRVRPGIGPRALARGRVRGAPGEAGGPAAAARNSSTGTCGRSASPARCPLRLQLGDPPPVGLDDRASIEKAEQRAVVRPPAASSTCWSASKSSARCTDSSR